MNTTRVAVLTPQGRGAIATVLVEGPTDAMDWGRLFVAANGLDLADQEIGRICFGHWGEREGGLPSEQVVVCRTGDNRVEVHCHGGTVAVARILGDLVESGARKCDWIELTGGRRGEPIHRVEIEVTEALAAATTWRLASILLDQQSGILLRSLRQIESTDWESRDELAGLVNGLLEWSGLGRWLAGPPTVVLAGSTNVGKSSLLNALLGFGRAIVWDEPGTTRDAVVGHTAIDGWPVRLVDTAGLRETEDEIEAVGIEHTRREIAAADLVLLVVDGSIPVDESTSRSIGAMGEGLIVANKCDLGDATDGMLPGGTLAVSALNGDGIDSLAAAIVARLVPRVPEPGTAVPVSNRLVECLERAARAVDDGDETGFRETMSDAIG